ncbi:MAG: hypothetical protein NC048_03060 [Bacteroides sp.]|nr:hypothetical protein [Ruminococcus flavefaciens]MCM1554456.1 hypothetical protein [Bacteroides sp.]
MAPLFASQNAVSTDSGILQGFETRFILLDSLIFNVQTASIDTVSDQETPQDSTTLAAFSSDSLTPLDSAYMERLRLQQKAFKHKTGLQLSGQGYYRFDHSLGFDEDDAVSSYDGKIQAELRWYFLQSSLFKRKGNMEELRLKTEIERTARKNEDFGLSVYQQREYFRFLHDSLLSGILQHRLENLNLLHEANRYLLERENISSDELLKVIDEKAEAERALAALSGEFPFAVQLSETGAFAIHVDTAALIEHINLSQNDMKLFDLRIRLLERQALNTSYWSHFNLAPFVRYSYYIRPDNQANTSNVDAGISFTIPITGEYCYRRKAIRAEQDVLRAERERLYAQMSDRIHYISGEIERLNRAMEGEHFRLIELKGYIALRTQAYRGRIGEYNLKARLKEYNTYLLCLEKMIELGYRRNNRLTDLQELLAEGSILQYCSTTSFDGDTLKQER